MAAAAAENGIINRNTCWKSAVCSTWKRARTPRGGHNITAARRRRRRRTDGRTFEQACGRHLFFEVIAERSTDDDVRRICRHGIGTIGNQPCVIQRSVPCGDCGVSESVLPA